MFNILIDPEIPPDSGVSIEYRIPLTSKRVDFILTGKDSESRETVIIIERKQWSAFWPDESGHRIAMRHNP
ncbi:MAG: hypothetical protein WD772_12155 [Pseudohongiellaceae bacterium]